jgi:predicted TIM-barrel fold metal-dependent hydrolase
LIKPVDPSDPKVAETIADWAATEAAVAVRIMLVPGVAKDAKATADPDDPAVHRVLDTAARHSLPVNLLCWGRLDMVAKLAAKHPQTSLIIDHMGLHQPFEPPAPAQPFADLPQLLDLAPYENVAVKITGACTLSHQPFPYADIWDPLARIFDAFGFDRCLWGTDWTRAVNLLTYEQGVEAFRLSDRFSDGERADLMGRTLARIYDWSPANK